MRLALLSRPPRQSQPQRVFRLLLGGALAVAGIAHLTFKRREFQAQVPPALPVDPDLVVVLSGFTEISLGAATLLYPRHRARLGWILAAYFVAIFPGNLAQYTHHRSAFHLNTDRARFLRLFFQPVLIAWALWSTTAWQSARRRSFLR